ncbi:MAG: phosphoglycerate kinase, partial [Eggerthellaceae bacterium]|nr:phosphoglycerate kinase [Eggerthellaceae bacterium]
MVKLPYDAFKKVGLPSVCDIDCNGKKVIVRVDFNVPLKGGKVADDTRIKHALPTIKCLLDKNAKIILMSHLGRPKGEGYQADFSLRTVADYLSKLLEEDVIFASDITGQEAKTKVDALQDGQMLLLENLRFDTREKKNADDFAKALASFADYYVNDAFGTSHRAHASTTGICKYLPSYVGKLLQNELETLYEMTEAPVRPFVAILGGAKVSDKIKTVNNLLDKCDTLLIGGGMAYTFMLAYGYKVGNSLIESDQVENAKAMMQKARAKSCKLLTPVDTICAKEFDNDSPRSCHKLGDIPEDEMGMDIGPKTIKLFSDEIAKAKTIFWNGPMG